MNPTLLKTLAIAAVLGSQLWRGYVRRRTYWDRRSWTRFAIVLAALSAALAIAFRMATAVDAGIYKQIGASDAFRYAWVTTMMALVLSGALGGVSVIGWFSQGEPSHPFPSLFKPSEWRAAGRTSPGADAT